MAHPPNLINMTQIDFNWLKECHDDGLAMENEFCEVGMFMLRLSTTKKYSGQIVYKCNVKAGNLNKLF